MEKKIRIRFTSDTHGHIFPINYSSNSPENSGLLAMAAGAEKDGNTLVLDGGDSLQGTPLTQYYLEHRQSWPLHPVAAAFNALKLDYYTLGNHDFNFGYEALQEYMAAMNGRCLCANLTDLGGKLQYAPWIIHTLENGLKVGITGVVTDFVNIWEQPQNLEQLRITDAFEAAKAACEELKGKCDLRICLYHGGFEEDLTTGRLLSDSGENIACRLARELDFDLLLTGHQHMAVKGKKLYGTYAVQCPANADRYLEITGLVNAEDVEYSSRFVSAGNADSALIITDLLALEDAVQEWLDQPIGSLTCPVEPEGKLEAALKGSRVANLFNLVQMEATGADISCTSLGNDPVGLASPVTMREVTAAYLFANTLVVLEVTEAVLRQTLERCAAYFTMQNGIPEISQEFLLPKVEHYNYDFYAGINYMLDLSRPVGQRVTRLTLPDGSPLGDRTYRLCTSNYRATGTGGYDILRECPVLWRGGTEMPDLTADYIRRHSPVNLTAPGEMKVIW